MAPNWIGDALMAQPLLARLRDQLPQARIDVLAPAWVAPAVRRMPEVSGVIETAFAHGSLRLRERWKLGRTLKALGYDQALVLPNTWKSALAPFFADIRIRSGYVGESRYGLLNLLYRKPPGREPMASHYARLADKPGAQLALPLPNPRLQVDAQAAERTRARFGLPARYVALCPGAEYGPAKRWPYFKELSEQLALPAVLLGSPKEREQCAAIKGRNLAGETTLDEAIELLALAQTVVSNDSGLMHVAAALGRPQVALFGSSSPQHTPPLSDKARVLWLGLDCSPCYARECPLGHFRCMKDLTVEQVLEKLGSDPVFRDNGA
ncbi:MAG TPA: lipopolysaccharide heptosyltransferase II [Burkholderiales bacterium]|nr:lipopolysaccharide heptosyltransferase II [Burkholderiales bacterium]